MHPSSTVRDIRVEGTFKRTGRSGVDIVQAVDSSFDVHLIDCGNGIGAFGEPLTTFLTLSPFFVARSLKNSTLKVRAAGVTDGFDAIKIAAGSDLEIVPRVTYPTAGYKSPGMCVWLGDVTDSLVHNGYANGGNRGVQVGTSATTATGVRVRDMLIKNNTGAAIAEGPSSDGNWFHDNDIRNGGITKVGANTRAERNQGYVTERHGTATIATGNTSVTVTTGLSAAPVSISLTGRHAEAAAAVVSTVSGTLFQIVVPSAVTADRQVMWQACA